MDNEKFAPFIAELRKEKRLTQKELADQLGVTDKAVSKWERGSTILFQN
ncbi:transcriptional regulator with XRE-family HTH domain [Anaerotaenia torta]